MAAPFPAPAKAPTMAPSAVVPPITLPERTVRDELASVTVELSMS
jgi:hypothetical protein